MYGAASVAPPPGIVAPMTTPDIVHSLPRLTARLDELGSRCVLVVTTKSRRRIDEVIEALVVFSPVVFDGARVHVPQEVVAAAATVLAESGADTIVAVGGGSAVGLGKALRLTHDVKFAAIPTTYAGSEMTTTYGITKDRDKQTGRDPKVRPDVVLYDVDWTIDMPIAVTVQSLCNAVAHTVSVASVGALDNDARQEAFAAAAVVVRAIEDLLLQPRDRRAREEAQRGASSCAAALERAGRTGFQHALAHAIGGAFAVDHAALHAVLLPHTIAHLRTTNAALIDDLERAVGRVDVDAHLHDQLVRAGAPVSLDALGVAEAPVRGLLAAREASSRGASDTAPSQPTASGGAAALPVQVVADAQHGLRPPGRGGRIDLDAHSSDDASTGAPTSAPAALLAGPHPRDAKRIVLALHGRGAEAGTILRRMREIAGHDPSTSIVALRAPGGADRWYAVKYDAPGAHKDAQVLSAIAQVEGALAALRRIAAGDGVSRTGGDVVDSLATPHASVDAHDAAPRVDARSRGAAGPRVDAGPRVGGDDSAHGDSARQRDATTHIGAGTQVDADARLDAGATALAHDAGLRRDAGPRAQPIPIVLAGFSQGACLALEVAARTSEAIAAVYAPCGARIGPPSSWQAAAQRLARVPIVLGAADDDAFISRAARDATAAWFREVGAVVDDVSGPGDRHEITLAQRVRGRAVLTGRVAAPGGSGFGNALMSEAIEGAVPALQNTPRLPPFGLYPEQINATGFTAPRAENRRAWTYRVRPAAQRREYAPMTHARLAASFDGAPEPNLCGFSPLPPPDDAKDFVDGLVTLCGAGDPKLRRGYAFHAYAANRSMERRALYDADGDLLVLPQLGALTVVTEMGPLHVEPGHVAIVPRGIAFSVLLHAPFARGYVAEAFGRGFRLPDRGPIGSNGLADPRHFRAPQAWYEDRLVPGFEIVAKLGGHLHAATQDHSPFDVVGWHGDHAPFVYDLASFSPSGNVRFDHGDPSVHTVLSAPLDEPGTHTLDLVVFPPRWDATTGTFRPPFFHRNVTSEINGIVREASPPGSPFQPGCTFITPSLTPHGVSGRAVEHSRALDDAVADRPTHLGVSSLWFQLESALPPVLTPWAAAHRLPAWASTWGAHRSFFAP